MFQITPQAGQHLLRLRAKHGLDAEHGVRFVASGGSIGLAFAKTPMADDLVVEGAELPIYVASGVAAAFDEAMIDAQPEGGETALVIRRKGSANTGPTSGD